MHTLFIGIVFVPKYTRLDFSGIIHSDLPGNKPNYSYQFKVY